MTEYNLRFTQSPATDMGAYKLLELPPELCKLIESASLDNPPSVVIKGKPDEDAVLCTADKTYALRSVVLSNSVLVVTPPNDVQGDINDADVVIRDEIHDILELVPTLPKLQKLSGLLRNRVYDEGHDEDEDMEEEDDGGRRSKRRKFTYENARDILQASDTELAQGLKDRRVLTMRDELRPIAPSHLTTILELLLNYLVSLSMSHEAAPVEELTTSLEDEQEVNREVTRQVMSWFGEIKDGLWIMDVRATVKEVGLGILRAYKDDPIAETEFLRKWKTTVGDIFEGVVNLELLSGNYLTYPSPFSHPPVPVLAYFPALALPPDPAARFADLFLTRARWKADDIAPFLADIVVDNKERDKLLLKYARATTDANGVWYTAKAKYNG